MSLSSAQPPAGDPPHYTSNPSFIIPFTVQGRIQQAQLYVSQDYGRNWQAVSNAQPGEAKFRFTARQDGWYYFAVRTIEQDGRPAPATLDQLQASLRVCVDTQRPVVDLRAATVGDGAAAVDWKITDENLDLETLRLDQRVAGSSYEWTPLAAPRLAVQRHSWNPGTNVAVEVRLQVRDRAGNLGEAMVTVAPGGGSGVGGSVPRTPSAPSSSSGEVRRINSKRISLNYELKDVGKSGVAMVELWYTRDLQARNWQKLNEQQFGDQPESRTPYVAELPEEGLFGITMIARSGVGLGDPPPRAGDPPQVWVEVDLTKPKVQLGTLDVGRGPDTGTLTISWSASDKNLSPRPITIFYAEKPEGRWNVITRDEENHSGRFVWRMPADVPYRFYVRVEATDLAGNVGSDEASKPIAVDLSKPRVQVIGIDLGK